MPVRSDGSEPLRVASVFTEARDLVQKDLGSYLTQTQRVQRFMQLAERDLKHDGITVRPVCDPQGTCLSKTRSDHGVGEGIYRTARDCGGLYARAQQLDATLPEGYAGLPVADAIYDHYKPESTGR